MTTGNNVDLANEISGLIKQLKAENPAISYDEITDTLIAAYCSVVAQMTNAAVRWSADTAANTMPPGLADYRQCSPAAGNISEIGRPSRVRWSTDR
jgi:hypothetical protein